MKRLSGIVMTCGLLAGLGSAALLFAHDQGGGWKERFGLSDEQAAKLKAARRANRDALTPLRDKMEDELDKLRGLVKEGKDEKAIAASLESVKSLHKAVRAEEERFHAALASALSPLQQAKMLLAMMRHMPPPGMGPGGWGGRHGPRMHGRGGHGEGSEKMERGGRDDEEEAGKDEDEKDEEDAR